MHVRKPAGSHTKADRMRFGALLLLLRDSADMTDFNGAIRIAVVMSDSSMSPPLPHRD
jgi:hypothetical protein